MSMCGSPGAFQVKSSTSSIFTSGEHNANSVMSNAMPRNRRAVAEVSTSPRAKSPNIAWACAMPRSTSASCSPSNEKPATR